MIAFLLILCFISCWELVLGRPGLLHYFSGLLFLHLWLFVDQVTPPTFIYFDEYTLQTEVFKAASGAVGTEVSRSRFPTSADLC